MPEDLWANIMGKSRGDALEYLAWRYRRTQALYGMNFSVAEVARSAAQQYEELIAKHAGG